MPFTPAEVKEKVKGADKLSEKQLRQFAAVFNSCHAKNGDSPMCYGQAWSVVKKNAAMNQLAKEIHASGGRCLLALSGELEEEAKADPLFEAVFRSRTLNELARSLRELRAKRGKEALELVKRAVERFGTMAQQHLFEQVSMFVAKATERTAAPDWTRTIDEAPLEQAYRSLGYEVDLDGGWMAGIWGLRGQRQVPGSGNKRMLVDLSVETEDGTNWQAYAKASAELAGDYEGVTKKFGDMDKVMRDTTVIEKGSFDDMPEAMKRADREVIAKAKPYVEAIDSYLNQTYSGLRQIERAVKPYPRFAEILLREINEDLRLGHDSEIAALAWMKNSQEMAQGIEAAAVYLAMTRRGGDIPWSRAVAAAKRLQREGVDVLAAFEDGTLAKQAMGRKGAEERTAATPDWAARLDARPMEQALGSLGYKLTGNSGYTWGEWLVQGDRVLPGANDKRLALRLTISTEDGTKFRVSAQATGAFAELYESVTGKFGDLDKMLRATNAESITDEAGVPAAAKRVDGEAERNCQPFVKEVQQRQEQLKEGMAAVKRALAQYPRLAKLLLPELQEDLQTGDDTELVALTDSPAKLRAGLPAAACYYALTMRGGDVPWSRAAAAAKRLQREGVDVLEAFEAGTLGEKLQARKGAEETEEALTAADPTSGTNSYTNLLKRAHDTITRARPSLRDNKQPVAQDFEELWAGLVEWAKGADNKQYFDLMNASADKTAISTVTLLKDLKTKAGVEFKEGERLRVVSYDDKYPYLVRLEADDNRKVAFTCERAWKFLRGFPKPPSMAALERMSSDGIAKAVDGARTEPDGFSPAGAPSWLLIMGIL